MTGRSDVLVTLSVELYGQLRARVAELGVAVDWVVAGLICDAIERFSDEYFALSGADSITADPFDRDYTRAQGPTDRLSLSECDSTCAAPGAGVVSYGTARRF